MLTHLLNPAIDLLVDTTRNLSLDSFRSQSTLNPRAALATVKPNGAAPRFEAFVHDPTECRWISRLILSSGKFEAPLVGAIVKAVAHQNKSGERFLDIGANLGMYSLSVAAAGMRAVAIEPLKYNTELLAATAARGGFGHRLTVFKTAVAATKSDESMCVISHDRHGSGNKGNGQLAPMSECTQAAAAAGGGGKKAAAAIEKVPINTVDSLLSRVDGLQNTCFAALKVDVEGFEVPALMGARSIFEGPCPPCLVVTEWVPYYNVTLLKGANHSRNPLPLLQSHGYKCKREASRHYECKNTRSARCLKGYGSLLV